MRQQGLSIGGACMQGFGNGAYGLYAGYSTIALNDTPSNKKFAFSFVLPKTKRLKTVKAFCSSKAGSIIASECQAEHYSSNADGTPINALIGAAKVLSSGPTANAWMEWDFNTGDATHECTAGERYWIVLTNLHSTPGTNYPAFAGGGAGSFDWKAGMDNSGRWGWGRATYASAAWSSVQGTLGLVLVMTDGSVYGHPGVVVSNLGSTVYGANYLAGADLTLHAALNFGLNALGVVMYLRKAMTPSGSLYISLWSGDEKLVESGGMAVGMVSSGTPYAYGQYFGQKVQLLPGRNYKVLLRLPDGSSANHVYPIGFGYWDSTLLNTRPFWGTAREVYTTDGGSTWQYHETDVPVLQFILDQREPFFPWRPGRWRHR